MSLSLIPSIICEVQYERFTSIRLFSNNGFTTFKRLRGLVLSQNECINKANCNIVKNFDKISPKPKLKPCTAKVFAFGSDLPIEILGTFCASVKSNDKA